MIALAVLLAIHLFLSAGPAQIRRRRRTSKPAIAPQAAKGSTAKYSAFLHSSDKHKNLACNSCHKIPTAWSAKRDFPDVADFPDHDACVRCHRQQFFTRQSFAGSGPTICIVCHVRAAPREGARFAFGNPNNAGQAMKSKPEWQFTIEFPHDKHQNVIASMRAFDPSERKGAIAYARSTPSFLRAAFRQSTLDDKKPEYNNCSVCHLTNRDAPAATDAGRVDSFMPPAGTFKDTPRSHNLCFDCHWRNLKPTSDDCAGCHKPASAFVPETSPQRISVKFSHEGGKGEHVMECTTCHINITRATSVRGLTPDVPIAACVTCHKDNKKTTYPKAVTIEEEFEQYRKTGTCTYCHTSDVGKKKPPGSHDAAAQ
ncbi:MAG: cytochrome c3 family protein [Pyrinomonadaceae bacterium]